MWIRDPEYFFTLDPGEKSRIRNTAGKSLLHLTKSVAFQLKFLCSRQDPDLHQSDQVGSGSATVLVNSVADPGCLSWIRIFSIPDPGICIK
jgi:hypothetical protein